MDLSQFKVKPHPAKKVFRQFKIPLGTISQFLDLSYNHVCSILSGQIKPTDEVDEKLRELAAELQKGGVEK